MERVPAHNDRAVGEVAEHAAGVFSRDGCSAAAADRVAQAGFVEGVRNGFLDGDLQAAGFVVKLFDHAGHSTRHRRGPTASTWHGTRLPGWWSGCAEKK